MAVIAVALSVDLGGFQRAANAISTTATSPTASLRSDAESKGLLIGAAARPEGLADARYAETLAREYNFLTPEDAMKWKYIEDWGFGQADKLVDFAAAHQMKVKGHTLIWHMSLPSRINDMMSSDQLRQAVQDHIRSVVGHFKGRVYAWDVVNEAFNYYNDGVNGWDDRLRQSIFLQKLGPSYIADAFRLAHEVDPDALLFYNDYGIEAMCQKSDRVYDLVKGLLAQGVPIHGVGMQMHVDASNYPDPESVAANVRRFAALGLKVNISEMDVQISNLSGDLMTKLQVQRRVYHDIILACASEPGFIGVTFWGFTDAYTWIQADRPLLFDGNYQPKPAYWGALEALSAQTLNPTRRS
jgi:GH35 family endo-1,4-beta-xylanase